MKNIKGFYDFVNESEPGGGFLSTLGSIITGGKEEKNITPPSNPSLVTTPQKNYGYTKPGLKQIDDKDLVEKFNFHLIPDEKNNYRSAQITSDVLPEVIKKYGIKNIIRMNGDGGDSKHRPSYPSTSKSEEQKICEENGCTFNFINSHEGYQEGKGYTRSIQKVYDVLSQGNTLIHCAHGQDRTGGMVAAYLLKSGIMKDKDDLWEYTTQYNGWGNLIKKNKFFGSGYDKYADGFYPISQLKKSKWIK